MCVLLILKMTVEEIQHMKGELLKFVEYTKQTGCGAF